MIQRNIWHKKACLMNPHPWKSCFLFFSIFASCFQLSNKSTVRFYHRNVLTQDDQVSNDDYLAISAYKNNPLTAKKLFDIAKGYIDTARASRQIKSVTLMAKDIYQARPYWDSEIWGKEKKYCLISFDFDYKQRKQDSLHLNMIIIWKNSEPLMYYGSRQELDSILTSPYLLTLE